MNIGNIRIYTDEIIPVCKRCFVMGGKHYKTGEMGWYAFCKKSGKLAKVGPYQTHNQALKYLNLSKNCDSCEFNTSQNKNALIPLLDERVKEEMKELYGDSMSVIMSLIQLFVENRTNFDISFKNKFNRNFFKSVPDDMLATIDFMKVCVDREGFSFKIQALAGVFDRINDNDLRKLIKDPKKQEVLKGSINILEQILKENYNTYPHHAISNLRNLMTLRSKMYPAHCTSSEILMVLKNFGIDQYPLVNWYEGWIKILSLCAKSLGELTKILQTT
jgi:hypothetical protein